MPVSAMPVPAMPGRLKAAVTVAALGLAPLALTVLSAAPAAAHGSMGDPVSRVSQCYAEGPESPRSAACKAAVAAGGTQALYDWNGIRIGDAAGRHQELIPDGKLCSANSAEFKGLDLPRADWPATSAGEGSYTFKYRVTAPHRGTFKVYLTKAGYDPAKPLAWSDLDLADPVATVTNPAAAGGFYTFSGTLPERSGRHVLYAVWQRSDSPEAFYSCSDVDFGGAAQETPAASADPTAPAAPAPSASAPSEEQIEAGAGKSTVENHGHGDADAHTSAEPAAAEDAKDAKDAEDAKDTGDTGETGPAAGANRPKAAAAGQSLAETGGDARTAYVAMGGAATLALGSAVLFLTARRRSAGGARHGR